MSVDRISENIYSIGVINPSLRIFDIVMEAKYGTSYNSYFIAGKKNVIIDTAHHKYFNEYYSNLQSIVDIQDIDYIILNHTEPDHSGSLSKFLEINPKIKVVCTTPGYKYIKQIINSDFDCICVKDGDTLDIGGTNLKFIVSPMLHWPDSMMTWFEKDNVLFSCDFLGCHFCEPTGIDTNIHYKKSYLLEFKYYFDCIFGPFKPYVLRGIGKIKDLPLKIICPSHGPVLTETISQRINDYYNWSSEVFHEKYVIIIYASAYGFTKYMAEAAAKSIEAETDIKVKLLDAVSNPKDEIIKKMSVASAVLIGSCTINRDAPKIIWDILSSVDAINSRGKPAGCFGSFGWSGEAVDMIESHLKYLGFKVKSGGIKVNFNPTEENIKTIRDYALEIAKSI